MAATDNIDDFDDLRVKAILHQKIDDDFLKLQFHLAFRFKQFEERFNCGRFKSEVRERAEEVLKALNTKGNPFPIVQVPVAILPRRSFSPFFEKDYEPISMFDLRFATLIFKKESPGGTWICTNLEIIDWAYTRYYDDTRT